MDALPHVMVVEDDPTVLRVVGDYLRKHELRVTLHADGRGAQAALRERLPDLLVVDRMLPGVSGDELCREVRGMSDRLPILMLTALDSVEERIDGLEHGADDYVGKPFVLRELLLRIQAMLRRSRAVTTAPEAFVAGPFLVDPSHRRVWRDDDEILLTTREYELLLYLVQHPDRPVTRDEILREVWGWSFGEASTVTVHVRRLREKIERDPRLPCFLRTEWGVGYRFALEERAPC